MVLAGQVGVRPVPAIGCAVGIERLVELYKVDNGTDVRQSPDVYVVAVGDASSRHALLLAEQLRADIDGLAVEVNCGGGSYKAQFKRADKSGAAVALILGEQEIEAGQVGVKLLRAEGEQQTVAQGEAAAIIRQQL